MEIQPTHLIAVALVLLLVLLGVQVYHLKSGSKCTTVSELQVHSDGIIEVGLTTSCEASPGIRGMRKLSEEGMSTPVVGAGEVVTDKFT